MKSDYLLDSQLIELQEEQELIIQMNRFKDQFSNVQILLERTKADLQAALRKNAMIEQILDKLSFENQMLRKQNHEQNILLDEMVISLKKGDLALKQEMQLGQKIKQEQYLLREVFKKQQLFWQHQNQQLKQMLKTANTKLKQKQDKLNNLSRKIVSLQEQLNTQTQSHRACRMSVGQKQETAVILSSKLKIAQEELARRQKQLNQSKELRKSMQAALQMKEQKIGLINQEFTQLRQVLRNKNKDLSLLTNENQIMKAEITKYEEDEKKRAYFLRKQNALKQRRMETLKSWQRQSNMLENMLFALN